MKPASARYGSPTGGRHWGARAGGVPPGGEEGLGQRLVLGVAGPEPWPVITPSGLAAIRTANPSYQPRRLLGRARPARPASRSRCAWRCGPVPPSHRAPRTPPHARPGDRPPRARRPRSCPAPRRLLLIELRPIGQPRKRPAQPPIRIPRDVALAREPAPLAEQRQRHSLAPRQRRGRAAPPRGWAASCSTRPRGRIRWSGRCPGHCESPSPKDVGCTYSSYDSGHLS